jgi:hypothetical protein
MAMLSPISSKYDRLAGTLARAAALVVLLLIFGWGCSGAVPSSGSSAFNDKVPAIHAANLRNKVALVPTQVETAFADQYTGEVIQDALMLAVQKECPETVLLKPGDSDWPESLAQVPRLADNQIDNFELATIGRQHGVSALIVVTLTSISADEKPWGYWFFKRTRYYAQGEMLIDVYDTETATKLLSRTAGHAMEIDALEMELIRSRKRFEGYLIEEIVEEIVDAAYTPICEALDQQRWKSFVLSSDNDLLLIASGRRSGLRPGHVLEVFDSSAVIDGVKGHRYYLSGQKIGEIKIKTVLDASAQAVPLFDQPVPDGSVVRIKK